MLPERSCEACGHLGAHTLHYWKWGYRILRCSACGMGLTDLPAEIAPESLYDDAYYCGGRTDGYANYAASAPILRREFTSTPERLN